MLRFINGRLGAKTAARLLTFGALFISAALGAQITWNVLAPERLRIAFAKSLATSQTSHKGFAELAELNLFGSASVPNPELPETRLNWTLKGIFHDQQRQQQAAVLVAGDGSQKLYWAGALLPGQVRLEEVLSDHVILNRAGQRETLRLKLPESSLQTLPLSMETSTQSVASITSVPHFLERVHAQALYQKGSLYGLALTQSEPQTLAKLGLTPNDVITHINGAPVGGLEGYRDLLSELQGAPSVDVTLEREGIAQQLTINMDDAK